MASEILRVPEEYLDQVILVIRTGLAAADKRRVSREVRERLEEWCDEEEEYLGR